MPDHFERLGLPGRFCVDPAAVERAYLDRSRVVHPDFHAGGTAAEQRHSLEQTAALNEAYLTLKDPFRRAEYLLALRGGPTSQQEKSLDQAFLMEMMDVRERIEEARSTRRGLDEVEADLTGREAAFLAGIAADFDRLDALPPAGPDRARVLIGVRRALNALKTVRSLLRDLRSD